jgi:hypothetical protein
MHFVDGLVVQTVWALRLRIMLSRNKLSACQAVAWAF